MDYHRYQEITTPDGYNALILLCAGACVTVWLTHANRLPVAQRYRTYRKAELLPSGDVMKSGSA